MFIKRRVSSRGIKLYGYQNRKDGKQVTTKYCGRLTTCEASQIEADRVTERERKRATREHNQRNLRPDALEKQLDERLQHARRLVAEALERAGYHEHRGEWRSTRRGRPILER